MEIRLSKFYGCHFFQAVSPLQQCCGYYTPTKRDTARLNDQSGRAQGHAVTIAWMQNPPCLRQGKLLPFLAMIAFLVSKGTLAKARQGRR
jgi:hypothetical protein